MRMQIIRFKSMLILFFAVLTLSSGQENNKQNPDPLRFKNEIDAFIQWDAKNSYPPDAVLFAGSSSIRMWRTHQAFPQYPVINRGFGGSVTADLIYFYEDVIKKYHARVIVLYVGDNDIAVGKSIDAVIIDYKKLVALIKKDNPNCKLIYLPIKPSISRWTLWSKMNEVNQRIKEFNESDDNLFYLDTATPMIGDKGTPQRDLFIEDGLHLNAEGYALWNSLLEPLLKKCY